MKKNLTGTVLLLTSAVSSTASKNWATKLENQGLAVTSLALSVPFEIPKDLESKLGTSLSLIFILGAVDAMTVKAIGEKIRSLSGAFKFVPLCLITDETPSEGLEHIDDIFEKNEPVARLKSRLELRLAQAKHHAETWQKSREVTADLAKKETALKQREEFLGVCAHDLRSPLGLVQSSIGLLLNSAEHARSLTPFQKELLARAERQSRQAIALVKDLLDLTSFEQGLKPHYQLLNLDKFLEEFYQDYAFQAKQKGVQFHYDNAIRDWRVLGDSERVRQLLQNLFSNALKFTEPGKNIYLEAISFQGRRKTDPAYPMIMISLRDEGPGIPKDEIQKIFDRFNQIKEYSRNEGRGLGLTVARQISQLHDGNVWAESEHGKGSTFRVLFPHVISRTAAAPIKNPPKRILIVEPNNTVRQNQYQKLRDWGYELVFAKDGVEAITFAFHEWADLIILAPELSKISTQEVTKMLKSDAIGGKIPLLLAVPADKKSGLDTYVVDAHLHLPLTQKSWETAMENLAHSAATPKKKAA
jgi:signal transduction histidine kinase